ncbi:MAG: 1-acyl-sn-glycerol-3-phosphate acyltransferase [Prolixibacteraceae bacterium]|nr:1-acyl-sn-glycerol-3-phosphate acyltransferase [Prolixibacteraceae bacterium]
MSIKSWSVGYEMIRTYVRFAFWLTHKSVVVTGRKQIPKWKPVIFAANHQNALMDPLALACTNSFQTVWLARADIFKSKSAQSFLKYIKLLPIYRIRDGKDNLSNNEQIFEQVTHILENCQSIGLFPEAAHSGKRQMLPHKKAIPRIALEAEAKNDFNLKLQIVPVGIFYDHYWQFNRTLIVQYGEPIEVDRYREEYADNPQKAMLSLRDEIHDRISPLTLHIHSKTHYQEYENIRQLAGESYSGKHFFSKNKVLQLFYAEQELVSGIEKLENGQPEVFEKIIEETSLYFQVIGELGVTDEQVSNAGKIGALAISGRLMVAFITFPFFITGFLFNAIPFYVPRMMIRPRVKDTAFLSTFNFVAGLVVFPIFYLIEASLIFSLTGSALVAFFTFVLMPFTGKLAFNLLIFYQETLQSLNLKVRHRSLLPQLEKQRNELISFVLEKIS